MRYEGDITEEDVWKALDVIYDEAGPNTVFTQKDVAEIIAFRRKIPLSVAERSVRNHFKRFLWRQDLVKWGNDEPRGRGRPHALYTLPTYQKVGVVRTEGEPND